MGFTTSLHSNGHSGGDESHWTLWNDVFAELQVRVWGQVCWKKGSQALPCVRSSPQRPVLTLTPSPNLSLLVLGSQKSSGRTFFSQV